MTSRAHVCVHEYVQGAFDDVLRVLRANRGLLGVEERPGEDPRADYANRRTAALAVGIDGFDANLLVFRIVGGRQEPVTELVLVTTSGSKQPSASAAQRFVEDLVRALEKALPTKSGGRSVERPERAEERARRTSRPRILVESSDLGVGSAAESMLQKAGYDTALCGGPEELRHHRCPLVTTGTCTLAEAADVIVHALDPNRPENAEVLRALRDHHPETPVLVEMPASARARHSELLEGCSVIGYMMIRSTLLGAVEDALRPAAGSR